MWKSVTPWCFLFQWVYFGRLLSITVWLQKNVALPYKRMGHEERVYSTKNRRLKLLCGQQCSHMFHLKKKNHNKSQKTDSLFSGLNRIVEWSHKIQWNKIQWVKTSKVYSLTYGSYGSSVLLIVFFKKWLVFFLVCFKDNLVHITTTLISILFFKCRLF